MARMTPEERQRYLQAEKLRRQKRARLEFTVLAVSIVMIILCVVLAVVSIRHMHNKKVEREQAAIEEQLAAEAKALEEQLAAEAQALEEQEAAQAAMYSAAESADMAYISSETMVSEYAIVIDRETEEIVASKNPYERMNPASMTKILTVLTAAKHIDPASLDEQVEICHEAVNFAFINDCSTAGYEEGEVVTVRDLFYGTILPSGGEAAAQLGIYVAGSMEEFINLMNDELDTLGLSETTHVTNMIGIYDSDHYSTVYDMAMILEAAMDDEICNPVMSAHVYTSSSSSYHPEGVVLSNWFLRRIEDKDIGGTILGAKTGYVAQSRNCCASCELSDNGRTYVCVTAGSSSSWRCIYDHVELYNTYGK